MALFEQLGHPITDRLGVNIVLHLGTLLSIVVFYWRRIWQLLGKDRRVIGLLVVGTLPAAVVGVVIKKAFGGVLEQGLERRLVAGCMFPLTGLLLIWAARRKPGETDCGGMSYGTALLIGLFQAVAILPGISRSGTTIAAGLGLGLRRDEAATFSFLLAIPVIAGSGLLETLELLKNGAGSVPLHMLVVGAAVSFLVGLLSLWWLVRWLEKGRLQLFAWWVIPLGVAVVAWQLL